MENENRYCWTCLHEENCKKWPPECVCEKWEPDPLLQDATDINVGGRVCANEECVYYHEENKCEAWLGCGGFIEKCSK